MTLTPDGKPRPGNPEWHRRYLRSLPRLRRLHADGKSTGRIARVFGVSRNCALEWLKRAGLAPHGWNADAGQLIADVLRRTAVRWAGTNNPGRFVSERKRVAAAQQGWPGAHNERDVAVLDALALQGPLTAVQLAVAAGYSSAHCALESVRRLKRAGLVTGTPGRTANTPWLYRLAPGITIPPRLREADR